MANPVCAVTRQVVAWWSRLASENPGCEAVLPDYAASGSIRATVYVVGTIKSKSNKG